MDSLRRCALSAASQQVPPLATLQLAGAAAGAGAGLLSAEDGPALNVKARAAVMANPSERDARSGMRRSPVKGGWAMRRRPPIMPRAAATYALAPQFPSPIRDSGPKRPT